MLIRPARKDEWLRVADVFIAARAGMDYLPQLRGDDETRAFIRGTVEKGGVWVAEGGGCVAGFAALTPGWLDHLYVHPREHDAGAGSLLLARVKMELREGFSLWTFQANLGARRFYERHGCREVRRTDGENEENLPDILYEWRP